MPYYNRTALVHVDTKLVRNPLIGCVPVTWMLAEFFIGELSAEFYARSPSMKAVEFL